MKDGLKGRKTLKVTNFLDDFEKDDIKKRVDIVKLFDSFNVKLSKKGKSYMGLCPWHEDKNPSLSVDEEKKIFHCFGCGKSGDVFKVVEFMQGVEFKEALVYLKKEIKVKSLKLKEKAEEESLKLKVESEKLREEKKDEREEEETGGGNRISEITLTTVAEYYHKKLFDNPKAVEYLKKRGLSDPKLYGRFQVGFCDGSLAGVLSEGQKKELIKIGILRENETEHFQNFLIFPILDDMGNAVGIYGRNINDTAKVKHLYLKGKHRGIFNRKASKVFDEIILTECIMDALSLIELGFENVQSIYGTNGFTEEHLQALKNDRVKTVIIAFDNDEPGIKASEELKDRLLYEGFAVKVVSPPSSVGNNGSGVLCKDWNEFLVSSTKDKSVIQTLIETADLHSLTEEEESGFSAVKNELGYIFTAREAIYRLTGVKEIFISNLKVNIRAELKESPEEKFYDNLDLYSARSRSSYSLSLSRMFHLDPKRVEKDLIEILEYLETERDRNLRKDDRDKKEVLSIEDEKLGMDFLRCPKLFLQIIEDMEIMGYVGEDLNKLLLYLAASSRILDDPISVHILSQSASGKSMLVDTVKRLIPPEDLVSLTSLSDQALNYTEDLLHKFLVLGESVHSDVVEHQIREMLSAKELSRLVTVKDQSSGKLITVMNRKPVIVSAVLSSTRDDINPENASRYFLINADESKAQTRKIQARQREKYSFQSFYDKRDTVPQIIRKHHAAQRLLKKYVIINPFAGYLDFPDTQMRTRRDHDRFIDLIAVVCFLRQYQKEVKYDANGIEYIECDLKDYEIAYDIMVNDVLSSTMTELSRSAVELYENLREMVRDFGKKKNLKANEVSVTQRDIREHTGFGHSWVKQNLRMLIDYEYVVVEKGGISRSKGYYRIREDVPIEKLNLSMIPSPEGVKKKFENEKGKTSATSATG